MIAYLSATGRIAESDGFRWEYLAGSNLKSQLTYPNDAVVTWTYEPHRDLLTAVTNATYSTYVYTNDLLGRRTSKNNEQYSYNIRDELIAADEVSYNYDDIGNRTTAEGKTYTANNLNQYTAIDDFTPQYDADGNQTRIKTETGIWSVVYNAENRPIRWQSGDTVITMSFDRMGRRVEMRTVKDGEETLQRFVYDNYLCIQQLRTPSNTLFHSYVWDPTEPIATRPLAFQQYGKTATFLMHDGNQNVTDVVTVGPVNTPVAHYDYVLFGAAILSGTRANDNPFRFSSEFHDDTLALTYYNYRHYNPKDGRWLGRDPIGEDGGGNLWTFTKNSPVSLKDILGLECAKQSPINVSLSASGDLYTIFGGSIAVALTGTVYDCCCDGVLFYKDAFDISITVTGEIGFGLGYQQTFPGIGKVGGVIKGPQYQVSGGGDISKGCQTEGWTGEITLFDMRGRANLSLTAGLFLEAGIGYSWDYGLTMKAIINGGKDIRVVGTYGYQRSGTMSGGGGAVTMEKPFADADFTQVFLDMKINLPW